MKGNLVGKYICRRDRAGDLDAVVFIIGYRGWDWYRVCNPDWGERTVPLEVHNNVFDTKEEAYKYVRVR